MSIGHVCEGNVITVKKDAAIHEAAKLMKKNHIGTVVIVNQEAANQEQPVGIITDRDIAKIVADEVELSKITVADAMSQDLLILKKDMGIKEAIDKLCKKGVRRAPVVDENDKLCGIASVDDLIILLADEFKELAELIQQQQ